MHNILDGAGVQNELATIRSIDTSISEFRSAIHRLGLHLAVHASTHLPSVTGNVTTPLAQTTATRVDGVIVLVPVLRAGLGLLDAFLSVMPYASVGFEGLRRDEVTLQPEEYYSRMPEPTTSTTYLVLDPMLATGGSLCATICRLKEQQHRKIITACVIASPEGLQRVATEHPDVHVVAGAVDSHLNDVGYIVPGLGDAGDRLYGTI